mmetsp:Transcript_7787/g.24980  ORF Transcript_7787/g.24980 Transcript_7787/m.24980 type:complete len:358 (-) Transcript_7787:669-1742(-)
MAVSFFASLLTLLTGSTIGLVLTPLHLLTVSLASEAGTAFGRLIVRWYLGLFSWLTVCVLRWHISISTRNLDLRRGAAQRILLSSNHPTRIDWALLYTLVDRLSTLGFCDAGAFRILMKADLARVPGLGIAMWAVGCGYLVRRNRDADTERLRQLVSPARVANAGSLILAIFPEGTDRSESNVVRTRAFADGAGLPVPRHLLLPRLTGITTLAREASPPLDQLWDATIVYEPRDPRVSEHSLLWASPSPTRILVDVAAASVEPLRSDGAQDWLQARWEAKDELMDSVYRGDKDPGQWSEASAISLDDLGYRLRLWLIAIASVVYNVVVLYGLATSSVVRGLAVVSLALQARMLWQLR